MSTETLLQPVELSVVVKGEVISDNFPAFKEYTLAMMEGINLDLKTDEDFKQAKLDVADLKKVDERLLAVDREIIESMDKVNRILTGTRELREVSAEKRKHLTNLAKTRTAELKADLVKTGIDALEIKTPDFEQDVRGAIARMSSLENMQIAISAKVKGINKRITKAREVIAEFSGKHGSDICHGESSLVLMAVDALEIELERRVERREADRKAEALRREAEELKAKANAAAKIEAEKARAEAAEKARETVPEISADGPTEQRQAKCRGSHNAPPCSDPDCYRRPEVWERRQKEIDNQSPSEEMAAFLEIFPSAFAPIKEARARLKHPDNIAAGERFAAKFGEIYAELEGGLK